MCWRHVGRHSRRRSCNPSFLRCCRLQLPLMSASLVVWWQLKGECLLDRLSGFPCPVRFLCPLPTLRRLQKHLKSSNFSVRGWAVFFSRVFLLACCFMLHRCCGHGRYCLGARVPYPLTLPTPLCTPPSCCPLCPVSTRGRPGLQAPPSGPRVTYVGVCGDQAGLCMDCNDAPTCPRLPEKRRGTQQLRILLWQLAAVAC